MDKIVLISPDERNILAGAGDRQPLGLMYLSSALQRNRIRHKVFDLNHTPEENVKDFIRHSNPQFVGLTYLAPTEQQSYELIDRLRAVSPFTRFLVGGIQVTNNPGKSNAEEIKGYGEHQLINLIAGTKEQWDIDKYPVPNRECLDKRNYTYEIEGLSTATMITSRGCPNMCAFCSVPNKKQERRIGSSIREELGNIHDLGYKAVHFYDDSFAVDKIHAIDVMNATMARKLKYRVELRANHIDRDLARKLGETGCLVAAVGVESGSDVILRGIHKAENTDTIRKAIYELGNAGVKSKGFFIIGLPGETEQTARKTIEFAKELKKLGMTYADFYPLMPFKGSPIGDNPSEYGIEILEIDTRKYFNGGKELVVPTQTRSLSQAKIKELITEARQ